MIGFLTVGHWEHWTNIELVGRVHLFTLYLFVSWIKCQVNGIRNIVALRGDPPAGSETWEATDGGFACALDLVSCLC